MGAKIYYCVRLLSFVNSCFHHGPGLDSLFWFCSSVGAPHKGYHGNFIFAFSFFSSLNFVFFFFFLQGARQISSKTETQKKIYIKKIGWLGKANCRGRRRLSRSARSTLSPRMFPALFGLTTTNIWSEPFAPCSSISLVLDM